MRNQYCLKRIICFTLILCGAVLTHAQSGDTKLKADSLRRDGVGTKLTLDKGQKSKLRKYVKFENSTFLYGALGIGIRTGELKEAFISPINNKVYFEDAGRLSGGASLGLVFYPFRNLKDTYRIIGSADTTVLKKYNGMPRMRFACALQANLNDLSLNSAGNTQASAVDVGFGFGLKVGDAVTFLGTIEFSRFRKPKEFFYNDYKMGDKELVLAGRTEPETDLDVENDKFFLTRTYVSFGLRVVYTIRTS